MSDNVIVNSDDAPPEVADMFHRFLSHENNDQYALVCIADNGCGVILVATRHSPYIYLVSVTGDNINAIEKHMLNVKAVIEEGLPNLEVSTILFGGTGSDEYDKHFSFIPDDPWKIINRDIDHEEDNLIAIEAIRNIFGSDQDVVIPPLNNQPKEQIKADWGGGSSDMEQDMSSAMQGGHNISVVKGKAISDDNIVIRIIRDAMEQAVKSTPITYEGNQLSISDIAGPARLLPAIMISASIKWAPVVMSNNGGGAFEISLSSTDQNSSSLGYVLSGIRCDDFLLLAVPVLETFRRMYDPQRDVFDISSSFHTMKKWMDRHGHSTAILDIFL